MLRRQEVHKATNIPPKKLLFNKNIINTKMPENVKNVPYDFLTENRKAKGKS